MWKQRVRPGRPAREDGTGGQSNQATCKDSVLGQDGLRATGVRPAATTGVRVNVCATRLVGAYKERGRPGWPACKDNVWVRLANA